MADDRLRLPLAVPYEPRDANTDKDCVLRNAYIDVSQSEVLYAVKRPGFVIGAGGFTVGNNRGVFYHNGKIFVVDQNGGLQGFIPSPNPIPSYYVVNNDEDFVNA